MAEKSFSERIGLKPAKPVQGQSMDADLRVCLWNAVMKYWKMLESSKYECAPSFRDDLLREIWGRHLKQPLDKIPLLGRYGVHEQACWEYIGKWYFHDSQKWHAIYEFVEFIGRFEMTVSTHEMLSEWLNEALEEESSAYRWRQGRFVPITNEEELQAVRTAASMSSDPLVPISMHIEKALEHLSDRTAPDYRNSMKESISAVEAICKLVADRPKDTLGPALDRTANILDLNAMWKEGFKKIYVYTSDAHGIRHSLKDKDHPTQEDARFLLIACSAFVNYITELARKQGKLPS